jgi:hypothetical protein
MTILANTPEYLVEFEARVLTISRRSDGMHVALEGRGIAGQFRECLKTHEPNRVVQTFLRITGKPLTWLPPLYRAGRMP